MRILLVGPGALGCLLAAVISRSLKGTTHSLALLDHCQKRAALLNRQGIIYESEDQRQSVSLPVYSDPSVLQTADTVILCVKSYDIAANLQAWQALLRNGTLLLFLQNGIAHLTHGQSAGKATIAYGTTTEGATLLAPGHVRHAGHGLTSLGLRDPNDPIFADRLDQLAGIFSSAGLPATVTNCILEKIWAKLFINVGINALTAIHHCANGDLLSLPGVMERMRNAVAEAETIARARNISIEDDPFSATVEVCRKTANNVSSMLQDVQRRRRTEIEAINGAIVRQGQELGLATPENCRLVQQVKEIEATYTDPPSNNR
jgi:2-dehydropantoate 2-reductase